MESRFRPFTLPELLEFRDLLKFSKTNPTIQEETIRDFLVREVDDEIRHRERSFSRT